MTLAENKNQIFIDNPVTPQIIQLFCVSFQTWLNLVFQCFT